MEGQLRDGTVRVGGDARQRLYDSRGYGRPLAGNAVELSRVEAAHLLFRDDLDAVDGMGFRAFFAAATETAPGFGVRFLVYADLRSRGFYLSPARPEWVGADVAVDGVDLVVYPRGKGPGDGAVAYRVRTVGERERVAAASLGACVLAVVDEESEITYLETDRIDLQGSSDHDLPGGVSGAMLADRVVLWDPPPELYERAFYGQPLAGRDAVGGAALQLSLLEAAALAERGVLDVPGGPAAAVERGRDVEGERFDRRLAAYRRLRERGLVPKTGFKFGADFRTYADVTSVEDLGHSERLVRVVPTDHAFPPRDLALDVRLAHGVRKAMTFGLVDPRVDGLADAGPDAVDAWLDVRRLTP